VKRSTSGLEEPQIKVVQRELPIWAVRVIPLPQI
jgi:hypothetical protein